MMSKKGEIKKFAYGLLALLCLLHNVDSFGWNTWNNNLLNNISDCPTFDGNRTGICVATAAECRNRGGRRLGSCYANQGGINGQNYQFASPSNFGQFFSGPGLGVAVGVCCAIQASCGDTIRHNGTYFRNPGAPAPFSDSRACSVTIARTQSGICQIRLDFHKFDLDRPRTGLCENDRFVVSGQASNSIIPPICGYNSGQHLYIDVEPGNYSPVTLNVITIGSRPRVFDYQNSLIGQIKSFNFEEFQVGTGTGYLSGLDYSICFKKPPGYCSVTYSVPRHIADMGNSIANAGQSQTNYQVNPGQYFNIIGMVGNDQAGAGHIECPQDYLQLANIPLCGSRLNNQLFPPTPNPTTNSEVVDNSTGPIIARFVSNFNDVGRGFLLDYRFNPCMVAG